MTVKQTHVSMEVTVRMVLTPLPVYASLDILAQDAWIVSKMFRSSSNSISYSMRRFSFYVNLTSSSMLSDLIIITTEEDGRLISKCLR